MNYRLWMVGVAVKMMRDWHKKGVDWRVMVFQVLVSLVFS